MYSYHSMEVDNVKRAADAMLINFKATIKEWLRELESESKSERQTTRSSLNETEAYGNESDAESTESDLLWKKE